MDKHCNYVEDTLQGLKTVPVFTMCLFVCLRQKERELSRCCTDICI